MKFRKLPDSPQAVDEKANSICREEPKHVVQKLQAALEQ
jgi:hypothetical protein